VCDQNVGVIRMVGEEREAENSYGFLWNTEIEEMEDGSAGGGARES